MDSLKIKEAGNPNKERIVFRADSKIDLGYFLLLIVRKIDEKTISSEPQSVFWFPDVQVKENDLVVVYTKGGDNKKKDNPSGNTSYFFYWGLQSEQFTDRFTPVLVEAKGWVGVQDIDTEKVLK